jgi:hypothetical protein
MAPAEMNFTEFPETNALVTQEWLPLANVRGTDVELRQSLSKYFARRWPFD